MTRRLRSFGYTRLSYKRWVEVFQPIYNYRKRVLNINGDGTDDIENFLTHDYAGIGAESMQHIWTLCDYDGKWYICPGIRWVNALGYLKTAKPFGDEMLPVLYGWPHVVPVVRARPSL